MPITTVEQPGYVEFVLSGAADADEIIDHVHNHFVENEDRCVLWSLTDADMSALSARRFEDIIIAGDLSRGKRRHRARTAFVVSSRPDYMLVTAFAVRAEVTAEFPMRVFESHEEAIDWLREG